MELFESVVPVGVESSDDFSELCTYDNWSDFESDVASIRRLEAMGAMGPGDVAKAIERIRKSYGLRPAARERGQDR